MAMNESADDPLVIPQAMPDTIEAGWQVLAHLYHCYFTGLVLQMALKHGARAAGEWSFRYFRRQHREKFLSSFQKLGNAGLPDAVAAARYHYFSNRIGGVEVEYMYESDKKAWVRFPHPRWIYDGTAICGVPVEVGQGFIDGWYGHNGVSLNNPRLGWVCTSQDCTAEIGFTGYFMEYDHELSEDERVRYVSGEAAPPFDADAAPKLDTSIWTPERLGKARRNYAMDYVKWGLFELVDQMGADTARELAVHTAALTGRQFYRDLQRRLGLTRDDSAAAFVQFMALVTEAHGDVATHSDSGFSQTGWRFLRGMPDIPAETVSVLFDGWNELWRGCLSVHNRFLAWETITRPSGADGDIQWQINTADGTGS